MQPMTFCSRCRGMKVGWNRPYVLHCVVCLEWVSKSLRLLVLTAVLSSFVFAFPISTGTPVNEPASPSPTAIIAEREAPSVPTAGSAVIEQLLKRYSVEREFRPRVATAIMESSRKHDVDPILVASILIVESRGNPFAVSDAGSMGIMQIHLATWGPLVDKEGINLFKIEDNIDLGVRILKDYIAESGLWDGVARYKGRFETPESYQSAAEYVKKVQRVYGLDPDAVAQR